MFKFVLNISNCYLASLFTSGLIVKANHSTEKQSFMLKTVWILFAFLFHFLLLPIEIVNSLINLLIKIKSCLN